MANIQQELQYKWLDAQIKEYFHLLDQCPEIFDVSKIRSIHLEAFNLWWDTRKAGLK